MKIFVLLSRIPYRLEKGDKLRAWHQIKELSKNHEIYLACLNDSKIHPEAESKLKEICKEVRFFSLNKIGIGARLFAGIFTKTPFQVHYFHSKFIDKKIKKYINEIQPDHIYAQLIRVSEYVKNIHHIPKTLDYMDALSKGMERRISKSSGILKFFLKKESKRLLEYENLIFDYFENKTIISEQDRALIYHPDQKKIVIISNGVDTDYFSPQKKELNFDLLFNGNMSYPPNIDCVHFIAEKILPIVLKKFPETKFMISGANPVNSVLSLANKNIHVSGWMDDIREAYWSSKIFIAPMQIGTGLQNKLLEAMAIGIPCVTTELANNALGATANEQILIGNTPEEIAHQIERLLTEPDLVIKISSNGRTFVTENYNWKTVSEKLEKWMIKTVNKN
jgi:sugar transferase (PEP-CTERM/EpsH1 system associated)